MINFRGFAVNCEFCDFAVKFSDFAVNLVALL